jgi:hypothetical protein
MPRKRIVLESLDPHSEKAKKLLALEELASQIRAPIVELAIMIDQVLSWIIATYFCPQEDRRSQFYSLILHGSPPALTLGRKVDVFAEMLKLSRSDLLEKHPDLVEGLRSIAACRNKAAHWRVDASDEFLSLDLHDTIKLLPFEGAEAEPLTVTIEEVEAKKVEWLEIYEDLVEVGDVVMQRSSPAGPRVKISGADEDADQKPTDEAERIGTDILEWLDERGE